MDPLTIAMIIILIMSVVIHEMAHGYAADWLGDPTARLQGRLSANPMVHIDPLMSVILPGLLIVSGSGFVFGAAKPVPYNPYNFTNQKWGEAIVAVAGPVSNLVLAVIFAVIVRFADALSLSESFVFLAFQAIILNLFLAFINLLPIPPLDGSKILPRFLPRGLRLSYERFRTTLEQNIFLAFGVVFLLFFVFFAGPLYRLAFNTANLLIGA